MRFPKIVLWIPALTCMAAIFVLSSFSKLPSPPSVFGFDKFQHFLAYAVLSLLSIFALRGSKEGWKIASVVILGVLISALYGITDEVHQKFVPNRCCDIFDWTSDVIGSIVGGLIMFVYYRKRTKTGGKIDGN